MAQWTHNVCEVCYDIYKEENSWLEEPFRIREPEVTWCCFCRDSNDDGIYVRFDPKKLKCDDLHEEDLNAERTGQNTAPSNDMP